MQLKKQTPVTFLMASDGIPYGGKK